MYCKRRVKRLQLKGQNTAFFRGSVLAIAPFTVKNISN